jgi:carbon monoxide dehydrogenase subunit G
MRVEGSGGPGFVRGEARIELRPAAGGGTVVQVYGEGQVGGTVAGVGQRMLSGVAKMLMKQMFDCVKARVEAGGP